MPPSLSPAQRRARAKRAALLKAHPELQGLPDYSTDPYQPTIANMGKPPKKPKPKPIPVPSVTIDYENPPPKPTVRQPVGPEPKGKKQQHGGHLPTKYEYMSPMDWLNTALGGKFDDNVDREKIKRQNQWRERRRRDDAATARAAEKAAREERRAAVRSLDAKARKFIGRDKIQKYIATGEGFEPGFMDQVGAVAGAIGGKVKDYAVGAVHSPSMVAKDIYNAGDWWINEAPEKALGHHEKGKGYQGGWAEEWDRMSTEEQIDTIVGGKSLSNVLKGEDLSPGNIGRAIALAAMVPIPWGKGLPSLASTLLRAGFSAQEVKTMIRTGEGLREALAATKQPVRPFKRAAQALGGAEKAGTAAKAANLVPPTAADAVHIHTWKPDAARIGNDALSRAEHMPVVVLRDEVDRPRAIAAYVMQGDTLVIRELAG